MSGKSKGKQRGRVENLIAHQWKKGQSGNPGGLRPTKGLQAHLRAELGALSDGKVAEQLIAQKLVRLAKNGDLGAIRECFDRTEGRPKQQLDLNDITSQLQGRTDSELLYFAETGTWPGEVGNG